MANIVVFGASGHAKVVIDIIETAGNNRIRFIVDDNAENLEPALMGYPVIGGRQALLSRKHEIEGAIVAIGANGARLQVAGWLTANGVRLVTALHPKAVVARGATVGPGTAIMAGSVVNSDTRIGANVVVNTGATIDHDCVIEDGVHVAPGCHLCGNVTVGAGSLLGVGAVVIPGVRIGRNAVIGAGSSVIEDLPESSRVAGSPARAIGSRK